MALDHVTRVLGRYEYTLTPMPARKASRLLARLFARFAPALKNADTSDVVGLVAALGAALDPDDLDALTEALIACTELQMHPAPMPRTVLTAAIVDTLFAAEMGEMMQWLLFGLEVNYGSFFAEAQAKMAARPAPATSTPVAGPAQ